jgi:hypothetical protein
VEADARTVGHERQPLAVEDQVGAGLGRAPLDEQDVARRGRIDSGLRGGPARRIDDDDTGGRARRNDGQSEAADQREGA